MAGATPRSINPCIGTNSIRLLNWLWKYVMPSCACPPRRLCSRPPSYVRDRSAPMGAMWNCEMSCAPLLSC